MEVIYYFKTENRAVFLLNGSFVENASKVTYREGEPIYITVLPLDAQYLPYTVKILEGRPLCNESLAECYSLAQGKFLVILKPRYNYVYSPNNIAPTPRVEGLVPKFFMMVKNKEFGAARQSLTAELSASLTDASLESFFEEYVDILENKFTSAGGWLLLTQNATVVVCSIKIRSGLIDNFDV